MKNTSLVFFILAGASLGAAVGMIQTGQYVPGAISALMAALCVYCAWDRK